MAYHRAWKQQEEASEDGSIALIFHDLSHSPLAFRERSTYEGGEEAARPPLAKQASATQSIKGVP